MAQRPRKNGPLIYASMERGRYPQWGGDTPHVPLFFLVLITDFCCTFSISVLAAMLATFGQPLNNDGLTSSSQFIAIIITIAPPISSRHTTRPTTINNNNKTSCYRREDRAMLL